MEFSSNLITVVNKKRLEGGCGGGGGAEQKPVSSRQSSTTATPRGVRYTSYTVTATSNVGSTVVTTVDVNSGWCRYYL